MSRIISPISSSRNRGGFMLLEVMVSMVILSTAIVTLMQCLNMAMRSSQEGAELGVASFLLQQKLADVSFQPFPEEEETEVENGAFDPPYERFSWTVEALPVAVKELRRYQYEEEGMEGVPFPGSPPSGVRGELVEGGVTMEMKELCLVTVTISWVQRRTEKRVDATTLRLRSASSGPGV